MTPAIPGRTTDLLSDAQFPAIAGMMRPWSTSAKCQGFWTPYLMFMYVTPLKLIRTFVPRCRRHLWIYLVNFCGMESGHFSLPLSLRQRWGVKCNL